MGLFKGLKDLSNLTKQAKELQRQQQEQAGYKPGFGGQMRRRPPVEAVPITSPSWSGSRGCATPAR